MVGKILSIPFSSSEFLFNEAAFGVAYHEINEQIILRQKHINQLQRLTYPLLDGLEDESYPWFPFPQTRFDHAIMIPPVAKIILEKFGFSERFIEQFILTALTHDAPTPAGGDATMRLNKQLLCEVLNYKPCMVDSGCSERWFQKYGYDVDEAAAMVRGELIGGMVLEFLDRWSYSALDVYHLGKRKPASIASLIRRHRFIMDIWKDICVKNDVMYFSDANNLYHFLKLRALMHCEFYLNPDCRKLEHLFFSETKKMLNVGEISIEDLRQKDDQWLDSIVRNGKEANWCTNPHEISWTRFDSEQEMSEFCEEKKNAFHCEYIKPFNTSMHLLVEHKGKIVSLREAVSHKLVTEMENFSKLREGWYAYCFK